MAIIAVMLVVLASIVSSTQRSLTYTTANVEQFRDAREAFESMSRKLSQATLNTYWDYVSDPVTGVPSAYTRQSDLRFVCGNTATLTGSASDPTQAVFFQAPLGYAASAAYSDLDHLLNTWGYFIEFGSDKQSRPTFLPNTMPLRYRFRLMEMAEPSDSASIYKYTSGNGRYAPNLPNNPLYLTGSPPTDLSTGTKLTGYEWFSDPFSNANGYLSTRPVRPIGENIVALIVLPKLSPGDEASLQKAGSIPSVPLGTSLSGTYGYDSTVGNVNPNLNWKNQLPPVVQVTMVAVDELSYKRFQGASTAMPANVPYTAGSLFTNASNYASDLAAMQTSLQNLHLNYRVFSSNVSIEGAKWSRAQKN